MKHSIVFPVAAVAFGLIHATGAWAKASSSDVEQHWVRELGQRIDAGFEAPSMAYRDRKLTTDVSFDLGNDGAVQHATVRNSSGSPRMDRAVLDAVLNARPLPQPPADLQGSKVIFRGSVDASRHFGQRR
jgi:TonB family protein